MAGRHSLINVWETLYLLLSEAKCPVVLSLGEDEFHQRMERFKAPIFQPSPSLVPSSPRTCSDLVSGIQQKLQGSLTPSSKQAVFIRQVCGFITRLYDETLTNMTWI